MSNTEPKPNRLAWFWRVEPTFGAWVVRAIQRAGANKITLPQSYFDSLAAIQAEIEMQQPGSWADVERRGIAAASRAPPQPGSGSPESSNALTLPGLAIVYEAVGLAEYGFAPRWDGWDKDKARRDAMDEAAAKAAAESLRAAGAEASNSLTTGPGAGAGGPGGANPRRPVAKRATTATTAVSLF